jgi:MFS family permease
MAGRWASLLGIRRDALKPFGAVWLSHLLVEVFLLMHPALVPVFREEFNLSILQAGLLISIPSICRLIIVIPTGILADKYGSFRFVVLSLLLGSLSALVISQTASVFFLILSITLITISVTLYHPPGMSVVSALFPNQSERSRAMGWHSASGCIGQAVGTISLGLLLAQYGWRFSYLLFSFPVLFWGLALARIGIPRSSEGNKRLNAADPIVTETKASQKDSVKKRGFLVFLSAMGLNALANGGIMAFMTTYLTSTKYLTLEVASVIFGFGPLVGIFGSVAAGYVSAKFGDKNSLALIFLGQFIFLLGLIAIPFLALAMFSYLMYQLFNHAVWTPSTSMVASLMGETGGGTAYSLFYFSHDLLGSASPLLAAVLIENLGFGVIAPFVLALCLLIVCALMVRFIKPE